MGLTLQSIFVVVCLGGGFVWVCWCWVREGKKKVTRKEEKCHFYKDVDANLLSVYMGFLRQESALTL